MLHRNASRLKASATVKKWPGELHCFEKKSLLFTMSGMMVSLPGFQPAGHTVWEEEEQRSAPGERDGELYLP